MGSFVEWDYVDLSLLEVHSATPACSQKEGQRGRDGVDELGSRKGAMGAYRKKEGMDEISGRGDNEERMAQMTGELERWWKVCACVHAHVWS